LRPDSGDRQAGAETRERHPWGRGSPQPRPNQARRVPLERAIS
jgi:hypothetical protein